MDVWVGRAGFKQWQIQNLGTKEDMFKVHDVVTIRFYIDHKEKPVEGYVSRIIDSGWYIVRSGKRQRPTL